MSLQRITEGASGGSHCWSLTDPLTFALSRICQRNVVDGMANAKKATIHARLCQFLPSAFRNAVAINRASAGSSPANVYLKSIPMVSHAETAVHAQTSFGFSTIRSE